MNMKSLIVISAASALLLAACSGAGESQKPESNQSASAKTQGDTAAARKAGPDPADFIKRFDADGDGTLEVAELPPRMQKWLGKADTNGDGKLDASELQANAEKMKKEHFARMDQNHDGVLTGDDVGPERWQRLGVADANGDGKVTENELDEAFRAGKLGPPGKAGWKHGKGKGKGRGQRMFKKLDADHDGALTANEVGPEVWAHIGAADANQDGKVTKDEMKAARDSGKLVPPERPAAGPEEEPAED